MRTLFVNRNEDDCITDTAKGQNSQDILGLHPKRSRRDGSRHIESLAAMGSGTKTDAIRSMGVVHHQSWTAPAIPTEQIDTVCNDLKDNFWNEDARVICNSFGAYIFLHAQAQLAEPYIGNVLLLSPIVGEFANNDEAMPMNFLPPRSTRLMELAQAGSYPAPMHCEMHVGSEDWQANPDNVTKFGELVGIPVHVVPDGGHNLPHSYVGAILDKFLKS